MNSWKIILAALVIFGAGVMAGNLVNHRPFHAHRTMEKETAPAENRDQPHRDLRSPMADRLGKQFTQQLGEKLQLTPEQKDVIGKIIAEGQEKNRQIWTNVAPQMRAEILEVHRQIREQLTPEQREQFEELLKRPRKSSGTNGVPAMTTTNAPVPATATTNAPGV